MDRILMCLDYNGTIDNLINKCADYESGGKFPTFFKGITAMSVATRSSVSLAIISSAQVDEIKEEITIINHFASKYCKLAIPDGENLINYIVGNKNQELYNYNTRTQQTIPSEPATKKEGVETVLSLPSEQGIKLLITGGDTQEDIPMADAQPDNAKNIFIAPKANKEIIRYESPSIIRDSKNNNSEGIGRCLITLSKNLDKYEVNDSSQSSEDDFKLPEDFLSTSTETDNLDTTPNEQSIDKVELETDKTQIPSQQETSSMQTTSGIELEN